MRRSETELVVRVQEIDHSMILARVERMTLFNSAQFDVVFGVVNKVAASLRDVVEVVWVGSFSTTKEDSVENHQDGLPNPRVEDVAQQKVEAGGERQRYEGHKGPD